MLDRLMSEFEQTVVAPALRNLETFVIGREALAFDALPSTNTLLREHAAQGAAEGLVILADEQTAGRGRRGRTWTAPPGTSLLLSVLARPTWLPPTDGFLLTMLAAVALAEAIETTARVPITLKWPNDLQIDERKLAGILVEVEAAGPDRIGWAIIGCGINVNWQPDITVGQTATSISAATGQPCDRAVLLQSILRAFDRHYLALRTGRREALRETWLGRLATLGQTVRVDLSNESFVGVAESVDPGGGLLVRCPNGDLRRVLAGDVSVRRASPPPQELDSSAPGADNGAEQ
jgi:BirA family biotin operon repressor/biotin-[acetyl-CoA-carboxylase] ligase